MDASPTLVTVTPVRFPALDGYVLGGFLHAGADPEPAHSVVFATGGGIRAATYRHFLSYLASHGIAVLAFDYRGIGESRPPQLRGFVAGFEDWAEYDAGGAIAWMAARYPNASLTGMGHSIGALMIGAPATAKNLAQLVLICPHTGYYGDYRFGLRLGMQVCWCMVGPVLRRLLGYFPASYFRFGEDLPDRIALQWAARSRPAFAIGLGNTNGTRERQLLKQLNELRLPALILSAEDDGWATENGIRRALHVYRNLLAVRQIVSRSSARALGHFGIFRRSQRHSSWPLIAEFLCSKRVSLADSR